MDGSLDFDDGPAIGRPPRHRWARITLIAAVALAAVGAGVIIWNRSHGRSSLLAAPVVADNGPLLLPPPSPLSVAPHDDGPGTTESFAPPLPSSPAQPTRWPAGGNITATTALLARLAVAAPRLPGATARSDEPLPGLSREFESDVDDPAQVLGPTLWSTAPGTVRGAMAYFRAHVDPSLHVTVTDSGSGGPGPSYDAITFSAPGTSYADYVELQVVVARTDAGVGVGVRGDAEWAPARPAAETITAPTSVELTVARYKKSTIERVLGQTQAVRLADMVNGLATEPQVGGLTSCLMYTYPVRDDTDTISFTSPTGVVTVHVSVGCTGTYYDVTANGAAEPSLRTLSVDLDGAVLKALGLSSTYALPGA